MRSLDLHFTRSACTLKTASEQEEREVCSSGCWASRPYQHTWPWLSKSSAPTHSGNGMVLDLGHWGRLSCRTQRQPHPAEEPRLGSTHCCLLLQAGPLQQPRSLMMAAPLQLTSQYMLSVHGLASSVEGISQPGRKVEARTRLTVNDKETCSEQSHGHPHRQCTGPLLGTSMSRESTRAPLGQRSRCGDRETIRAN